MSLDHVSDSQKAHLHQYAPAARAINDAYKIARGRDKNEGLKKRTIAKDMTQHTRQLDRYGRIYANTIHKPRELSQSSSSYCRS